MTTLRNKFHDFGNWLNKVNLAAIVTREALDEMSKSNSSSPEARKVLVRAVETLRKIESYVEKADETIGGIKSFVTKKLGADTEIT